MVSTRGATRNSLSLPLFPSLSLYLSSSLSHFRIRDQVEFVNKGDHVVQMLTRHWVFVDAHGKVDEVKGPGARGHTPILQPGGRWGYESGTGMSTATGSMRGSFQLETLSKVAVPGEPRAFSAHVARLGLSTDGQAVNAPCGDPAALSMIPTTSVHATQRIIVGVTSSFEKKLHSPVAIPHSALGRLGVGPRCLQNKRPVLLYHHPCTSLLGGCQYREPSRR
jgi:uncharacterized protein affecting Mg2+/Co2+ transport